MFFCQFKTYKFSNPKKRDSKIPKDPFCVHLNGKKKVSKDVVLEKVNYQHL